jgi:ribosomal protein S25
MISYQEARRLVRVLADQRIHISIHMVRRRIRVSRPVAKRLLRELEWEGVVGPPSPGGTREVLSHA